MSESSEEDEVSKKVVAALTAAKPRRNAAKAAKEKLKQQGEDDTGKQSSGKRRVYDDADDSDDDPDFDHDKALKEKRKDKEEKERKTFPIFERNGGGDTIKKSATPSRGRGRGGGFSRGGVSGLGPGRKRPLGTNIRCPFCDEGFNTLDIVMDHVMASHENEKRYVCKVCSKPGVPKEFPFFNNVDEHMSKEHNHNWTRRDKYDPLQEKPVSKRVRMASKFCVIPKENSVWREDLPKPKVPRAYGTLARANNEKPTKILCPRHPKCAHYFYNDDPRVITDHLMSEHLNLHRYHCHKCGTDLKFNTLTEFQNHMKEKHKVNPSYQDAATDIYLVCQKVPQEIVKQLNLEADDVEAIETMGRGREDRLDDDEEEDEDDSLVIDEKWEVFIKGMRLQYRCSNCDEFVEGRSGVISHNRDRHGE